MLVDRWGEGAESGMVTTGLHGVLGHERVHRCAGVGGLVELETGPQDRVSVGPVIDLVAEVDRRRHDRPPPHRSILARWGADPPEGDAGNLLGDSVRVEIDDDRTALSVPLIDADATGLLYYGALLVDLGERLTFGGPTFPVWRVEYGSRYADDYLLTEQGGGFYLEWHTDRPHWHQPLSPDAAGFYLLARRVGPATDDATEYHLTGFRIPVGSAVFTRPGAIHCDAALTGTWAVGYADSQHYSTALIRNRAGAMVTIEAVDLG